MVVDVDAFALQNAFEANYGIEPGKVVALVNAGASATNINLVCDGTSLFTRDVGIGGNAFTEAIQKELGLPFEGAEDAKKGLPVEGVRADDLRPVLHAVMDNVLLEIEKTFDFFKATSANDRIDRVIVSGGGSLVERLRAGAARAARRRGGAVRSVQDRDDRPGRASGRQRGRLRAGVRRRARARASQRR